jgi:hypothetical protein
MIMMMMIDDMMISNDDDVGAVVVSQPRSFTHRACVGVLRDWLVDNDAWTFKFAVRCE